MKKNEDEESDCEIEVLGVGVEVLVGLQDCYYRLGPLEVFYFKK